MIKFFRKIRKKTLSENKFGKYLTYAIGEIILVVIGILIALSINNHNNNRQQRKIEQAYLLSLQSEFKTNLEKINNCLTENYNQVKAVENMLTLFDDNVRDTISEKEISNIIFSVFKGVPTFIPSKGVLTDIISSGNLNLIQNEKLRQEIASFDSTLDLLKIQEVSTHEMQKELQNQLNENGSVRKVLINRGFNFEHRSISDNASNKKVFGLIKFENTLLDYYLTINATNGQRFFGGIKEQIEQILVDLDSEIIK
ncbi:hypothetical protein HNV10_03850 [Winogradskyella litoriviva]|uniref:EF-hand domain-containing protein n=1 Tax=Winogradskyella litoriviva TaxID=1220182 RepID=A0ABX2E225_9FLAO|nr:DUF6090 family protein [Winogradskyella litoriviva]NRD22360.1 hypothetical protein [Winogradskyella litoriviva]